LDAAKSSVENQPSGIGGITPFRAASSAAMAATQ
jgi:hypothetical protein